MWKIATVMLTTALFAGLLIANPYDMSPDSARPTILATLQVPSPTTEQTVVTQDQVTGENHPTPAPDQPIVEQLKKIVVAVVPARLRNSGNRNRVHFHTRRPGAHNTVRTAGRTNFTTRRNRVIV
jgi:hypothetical protein